jgi:hypothetical protein
MQNQLTSLQDEARLAGEALRAQQEANALLQQQLQDSANHSTSQSTEQESTAAAVQSQISALEAEVAHLQSALAASATEAATARTAAAEEAEVRSASQNWRRRLHLSGLNLNRHKRTCCNPNRRSPLK